MEKNAVALGGCHRREFARSKRRALSTVLVSQEFFLTFKESLINALLWFSSDNFLKRENGEIKFKEELNASSPFPSKFISIGNYILGLSLFISRSLGSHRSACIYFKPEHMIKTKTELILPITELLITEK